MRLGAHMRRVVMLSLAIALLGACGGSNGSKDARAIADRAVAEIDRILTDARTLLTDVATLASVRDHTAPACNAAMAARARSFTVFGAIGVADAKGDLWCLSIPFTPPVSTADRAYFKIATGTGDLAVGDFQIGRVTGAESVIAAYPVVQAGDAAPGVVLVTMPLTKLTEKLRSAVTLPEGADVIVTDGHGTVLARPSASDSNGRNLGGTGLVGAMLRREAGSGEFVLDGVRRAYVYRVVSQAHDLRVAAGVRVASG